MKTQAKITLISKTTDDKLFYTIPVDNYNLSGFDSSLHSLISDELYESMEDDVRRQLKRGVDKGAVSNSEWLISWFEQPL